MLGKRILHVDALELESSCIDVWTIGGEQVCAALQGCSSKPNSLYTAFPGKKNFSAYRTVHRL